MGDSLRPIRIRAPAIRGGNTINTKKYTVIFAAVAAAAAAVSFITYTQTIPHNGSLASLDLPVVDALQLDTDIVPGEFASANNAFAMDFYKHDIISGNSEENIFFSPASIYTAFSMTYEGAIGDTATEMEDVFGFDPDGAARHNTTAHTMSALNRDDGHSKLRMANALWFKNPTYEQYDSIIRQTYLADVEIVDFLESSTADRINDWASNKTNNKITEVVSSEDFDALTRAVLTNAIYFKGEWVAEFPEENTAEADFWRDGSGSKTDFMNIRGFFDYAGTDDVQILKLPYKGDRLSMLVILPNEKGGMSVLEELLSVDTLQQWRQKMSSSDVVVSMPKFTIKTHYDLKAPLVDLGVRTSFNPDRIAGAKFSKMLEEPVFITKAVHDAFVDVNEEGTEAAAVTTIIMSRESASPPPKLFVADHPFLFIIQDDESGAILFMGRLSDPS